SIIPSIGTAPGPVNLTTGQYVGDFTLAAGDYRAASTAWWMYESTTNGHLLKNGTLWYGVQLPTDSYSYEWTYSAGSGFSFENYGKVVVDVDLAPNPYVQHA